MPEGPEVRRLSDSLKKVANERPEVVKAEVLSGRYTRTPIPGLKHLVGYRLFHVTCKGKLLLLSFTPPADIGLNVYALSTLGMTGWWHVSDTDDLTALKHARLRIDLGDKALIFTDPRNFGTFRLTTKNGANQKITELGTDITSHAHCSDDTIARFRRLSRDRTIAEVLLDQRIFAGVGNYLRADAMYLTSIDPRRLAKTISDEELRRLWNVASGVASSSWLGTTRGAVAEHLYGGLCLGPFKHPCYGQQADKFGHPIERFQDSNGRTVWWCPAVQATAGP